MKEDLMKKYETLFSSTEKKVRKFWRHYKQFFPDSYMGLNDLQQDLKVTLLETIAIFAKKDPGEVEKICGRQIEWKLVDLLREAVVKQKYFINQNLFFTDKDGDPNEDNDEAIDVIQEILSEDKTNFKLAELLAVLTDFEFAILREIFVEKKFLTDIAEEHSCSPQNIQKIYSKIKVKIKHYLIKKQGAK